MSRKNKKATRPLMPLLPLGALAAGFGLASAALAQTAPAPAKEDNVLPTVRARASAEKQGKDDYQATETRIGKGKQDIRDIPQSLTVITEKVMDDRNFSNVKEVLKNTAGISFQAAEGGEEDVKVHGISLQSTGDIFIDGMRDPAFYDRDTFFLDKIELLRGSASLLFGRGSTGGAVNQVTKQAQLADQNQIDVTVGSHGAIRAVVDFDKRTGETSGLRVSAMTNTADSNGAGSKIDKRGIGLNYRYGVDETDEFGITLYGLQNDNGINYGVRWMRQSPTDTVANKLNTKLDPDAYYGLASDFNKGTAYYGMLSHTHRFSKDTEVVTKVRYAEYTRDQRATLWNFAAAAQQPGGQVVSLDTLSNATVLTRGFQPKKQDMQTVTAQSDLSTRFDALGFKHTLQAGVDFAKEKKQVFGQITAAQGGIVPTRPNTTIGSPSDGASIDESLRSYRKTSAYVSDAYGGYVQDMIEVAPMWKVLAGLRYDHLKGDYDTYAVPTNALTPVTTSTYQMKVSEVSKRGAVLFQPDAQWSFHLMGATSFNTSGDAYSLNAANQDIPPEKSVNVELGAKWDSADGRLSLRASAFRNTKLHERNTDPLNANVVTLSGKRHAAGLDFDVAGRITPAWEVFGNFTWIPVAKIDISSATGGELQGQRPSLTPRYSGSLWTAYQVLPQLRLGAGVNARSGQTPNRNPANIYAPKFVTADVMAEYTVVPDQLSFKLYVSNIANKLYADQLYTSFYVPGTGRVTSLTGTYKF
ncbi:TonB-dependent receptor [Roseateles puraquae]|uniref:TonB-dependent siderophore receptor n=1 Tax=Roseateles puraquae TaxID=431059 RepID=A0A254N645_9BURK|nr:TonB-dependent receptor [Roseateles puraquae]MDG0855871.1 TonB-dependent receptor [Roseateles puraquae]MDG0855914.1 TonB-dependent receptor [Roseateles puraquae]OWR03210.1 TonB-dependent siderophore receptor [Roseateles puraquae]